ncbi:MAG: selenocysteine-specific translation elongation factor [Anaerolineales bacterium]|nr:selenocysteine-specific translation elongation factor [Anaerolineales bacterium]
MRVIGTAGHVDHGKSTLIAALTGINPDRLKEEQEREMTIDLGFAWLTLPLNGGEEIGIVDVPGHRDFIENMLAGVGGIDAALLVIAADEGVMPQTREHLAILDLLQISAGLVVLTKIDLIDDPDWLDLVESDVRQALKDTVLADAPIIRVSSKTKAGFPELLGTLGLLLQERPTRPDLGRPRLPVDRVFSIPGFGTVVTGTLTDGRLNLGEEVVILPAGLRGRVRGLQTHKKKEEIALPGSRTAVNISGVNVDQITRGEVIAHPGQYQPTRMLDVRFRLLPDVSGPLRHASEVKLFIGASETIADVRLLGTEVLAAGQEGWLQLELRHPVIAVRGDRYILRRPSPGETLGGGVVVDPHPKRRHKRFDEAAIQSLEALAQGSPADVLVQASLALGPAAVKEVVKRARLEVLPQGPTTSETGSGVQKAATALEEALSSNQVVALESGDPSPSSDILIIAQVQWSLLKDQARQIVEAHHRNFPLRRGMPREELKSRLKLTPRVFNASVHKLAAEGVLTEAGSWVARAGHEIRFDIGQQAAVKRLMARFDQSPYSPPTIKECQAETSEEVFDTLVEQGDLVTVSSEVVFRKSDYDGMLAKIRQVIQEKGQITIADVRDLFDTSRRYALALMEHLDSIGVTVREGDARKLRR